MDTACVKAHKTDRLNAKHFLHDKQNCWITSLAVTNDNRVLMLDFYNKKIKIFGGKTNAKLNIIGYIPASAETRDISIVNESEAVATVGCEQKLNILDISEINNPDRDTVKDKIHLDFDAMCVAECQDAFIVTCPNTPVPSVKRIDRRGHVVWSITDERIPEPWYVCSNCEGTKFYLSGRDSHWVVKADSQSGELEETRKLEGKHPRGLCTDKDGFVYVCYQNGVGILTQDLSQERTLMSEEDGIDGLPEAIAYDVKTDRLFISYSPLHKNCNSVDIIQLTK